MREVLIDLKALKSNLQKIKKHAGVPVMKDVKYKKVEDDIKAGRCIVIEG